MEHIRRFLEEAKAASREAGLMLKVGFREKREVAFKGVVDLVTNFDRSSQRRIFERLSSAFPEHGFLAEEGLCEKKNAAFRWVFDPLDGTTNFAHAFPIFCVSIALERERELILGVVFDPMRNEMFWATKGRGAYLNGRRIRVSSTGKLGRSLLATGFPYDIRKSRVNNIAHFNRFVVRAQAVRRCGSAALDLCYVACGRFDGFWELKLKPWDIAAGALILLEAGGLLSDFQGRTFRIDSPETLASNGIIHQSMVRVLQMEKISRRRT